MANKYFFNYKLEQMKNQKILALFAKKILKLLLLLLSALSIKSLSLELR